MMSLHRADLPDWENIPTAQLNGWQRLAARSGGIIAPANFISLIGGLLVIYGLYAAINDSLVTGVTFILLGRYADVLDGIIAHYTKTKSPLGEAVDATMDKILLGLALIFLISTHLIPLHAGLGMTVIAICGLVVFLIGRLEKIRLHPSLTGKIGAALEWLTIGLYLLGKHLQETHHSLADTTLVGANLGFGIFVIVACTATINYYRYIYYKKMAKS